MIISDILNESSKTVPPHLLPTAGYNTKKFKSLSDFKAALDALEVKYKKADTARSPITYYVYKNKIVGKWDSTEKLGVIYTV